MATSKEAVLPGAGSRKARAKEGPLGRKRQKVVGAVAAALRVEPPVRVVVVEVLKAETNPSAFHGLDNFFSELKQEDSVVGARRQLREIQRLSHVPLKPNQHRLEEGKGITIGLFHGASGIVDPIIDSLNISGLLSGTWSERDSEGIISIDTIFPGVKIGVKDLPYDGIISFQKGIILDLSQEAVVNLAKSPILPAL